MEKKSQRISVLGPVLLIAVGLILLLNTLGVVAWSVWWTILRLWPVLLIAIGLDLLLGRRSIWGSLLAAVLVVAVLAGALWLTQSGATGSILPSQEISQPLGSATQAEVALEPAAGALHVEALAETANLVEGKVYLGQGETVTEELGQQGEVATYTLKASGTVWEPFGTGREGERLWDLGLSPGASLQLTTHLGAGETVLDLTGLTLTDLTASTAVGRTEVTLPAEGHFAAKIEQPIGQVEIVIPEGMSVRLQANTALAGRQLPDDLKREGDNVYVSPGYATADNRVDLNVSIPIGLLTVRYME